MVGCPKWKKSRSKGIVLHLSGRNVNLMRRFDPVYGRLSSAVSALEHSFVSYLLDLFASKTPRVVFPHTVKPFVICSLCYVERLRFSLIGPHSDRLPKQSYVSSLGPFSL